MSSPKAYVLLSKYHGSNQQLIALANQLVGEDHVLKITCELRSRKKLFLPFFKLIFLLKRIVKPHGWLFKCLGKMALTECPHDIRPMDFIISKTPPFELPALMLTAGTGARSIHIGTPKRMKRSFFNTLISTPSTPVSHADIELEVLPTSLTFTEFQARKLKINRKSGVWLMLIGGDAKGIHYDSSDWDVLINELLNVARIHTIKWLVVTSPRSCLELENRLSESAEAYPKAFEGLVLWGEGDRTPIAECLARSEVAVVTEDSASMISEALNCRLPVFSCRPEASEYNSLTTPLVEHHEICSHLKRFALVQNELVERLTWLQNKHKPLTICWAEELQRATQKLYPH